MGKGQFAMELLLVISFSLLILIPVIALLYQEYDKNRTDVHLEHLSELAREITYQSERIYYQGPPSRITIEAFFPPQLAVASINENYVYFELESTTVPIEYPSSVPLSGSLRTFSGPHRITLQAHDNGTPTNASDDYVYIIDE